MGRTINTDSPGKERNYLTKAVVLAVRELALKPQPDEEARDLAAFLALALKSIARSIDISALAWEKRGYWVKADRFRMEWLWAEQLSEKMQSAILALDWGTVAEISAQIAQKVSKVTVAKHHRLGRPWVGARKKLCKE